MYLLDTNILSELRKGERCDSQVRAWAKSTAKDRHCVSVLSLGEIRKGIEILRRKAPDQCPAFEVWLTRLQTDYDQDILPLTAGISERWGRMGATMPQALPVIDGLIAATAQEFGLTVVTRNTADFDREGVGVRVVNPFE